MTHWRANTHVPDEMFQLLFGKSLHEDICYIVIGRILHELKHTINDELPYKMVVYLDVLRSSMEHWILGNHNAIVSVTHHDCRVIFRLVQILKDSSEPYCLEAIVHATQYSTSIEENATVSCVLISHDTTLDAKRKQEPSINYRVSMSSS